MPVMIRRLEFKNAGAIRKACLMLDIHMQFRGNDFHLINRDTISFRAPRHCSINMSKSYCYQNIAKDKWELNTIRLSRDRNLTSPNSQAVRSFLIYPVELRKTSIKPCYYKPIQEKICSTNQILI